MVRASIMARAMIMAVCSLPLISGWRAMLSKALELERDWLRAVTAPVRATAMAAAMAIKPVFMKKSSLRW